MTAAARRLIVMIMPIALGVGVGVGVGVGGCGAGGSANLAASPSAGTRVTSSAAESTACPSQSQGGDNLPNVCAPSASSTAQRGLSPPPTDSGRATTFPPTTCSDPAVTGVSPGQGEAAGGDTVTVTGSGFGSGLQVLFGGVPGQLVGVSAAGAASVVTPPGPSGGGTVAVTVSCNGATPTMTGPAVSFTYAGSQASP